MKDVKLNGGTDFLIGAVVAPMAEPWEPEMLKFEKRGSTGARGEGK